MKTREKAEWLGESMLRVGETMGTKISYLLTAMDEPMGRTVGNALELAEAIDFLHGRGPTDVINLVLDLATKVANAPRAQLQKWLQDGTAWKKFVPWWRPRMEVQACLKKSRRFTRHRSSMKSRPIATVKLLPWTRKTSVAPRYCLVVVANKSRTRLISPSAFPI
jgi:thymidine phosphorylase